MLLCTYTSNPTLQEVSTTVFVSSSSGRRRYAGEIDAGAAEKLAARGCGLVVDAGYAPCEPAAIAAFKKLGVTYAPFRATMAAGVSVAWSSKERAILKPDVANAVDAEAARIHDEVVRTATEYNVRGDLHAGANIASFLRVADVMASHGCV